jgi:phosphate transport system protein
MVFLPETPPPIPALQVAQAITCQFAEKHYAGLRHHAKLSRTAMTQSSEPQPRRQHTSRQFDQELSDIQSRLFALGGLVEEQISLCLKSLVQSDLALAEQVIRDDYKVNTLEVTIDEECTRVLARRQPAASDLRLVMAVIKTITDLERIGDDAKRIAKCTLHLSPYFPRKHQLTAIHEFGGHVKELLKDALNSMARLDVDMAFKVKQNDRQIDREYQTIMHTQLATMSEDARQIPVALNLMWVARSLERIGDRACNICEYVIYYVLGKDIRHMSLEQAEKDLHVILGS